MQPTIQRKLRGQNLNFGTYNYNLAPSVCKALLGFHAILGCDQTGRFSSFLKISCWEMFLDLPNNVLDEFSSLGASNLPSDSTLNTLEQFVLWLYCKNKVPSDIKNLSDLRWKMFAKQQADSQRLPLTSDTFRQKVLWSHYTVMVWKQSHVPSQTLRNPEEYGWKLDANEEYEAVRTTLSPATESIIHLTVCHCKTKCYNEVQMSQKWTEVFRNVPMS